MGNKYEKSQEEFDRVDFSCDYMPSVDTQNEIHDLIARNTVEFKGETPGHVTHDSYTFEEEVLDFYSGIEFDEDGEKVETDKKGRSIVLYAKNNPNKPIAWIKFSLQKDPFSDEEAEEKKIIYIGDVTVEESYQGRGIAQKLFAEIEKYAMDFLKTSGQETIDIDLRVDNTNARARDFYKKQGFTEGGTQSVMGHSLIYMSKTLSVD